MFRPKAILLLSLVLVGLFVSASTVGCRAPAAFEVANLAINPARVSPGEKVTITAEVTNTGGVEGSYTAELRINDAVEATEKVTVAGGASQLLSFVVSRDALGTYKATLGELGGEFTVAKLAPPPPPPPFPPSPPKPPPRTLTLTDADAIRLLNRVISGGSVHFAPENKAELKYKFLKRTFTVGVSEGKLWLDGVPSWLYNWLSDIIGDYTTSSDSKLFLTALPPGFDPTKEIAPDVTKLPTFESITTEEGEVTITYFWP